MQFLSVDSHVVTTPRKDLCDSASILQVSTSHHVFIFDFVAWNSIKDQRGGKQLLIRCNNLLSKIFCSPKIIKVGWGFELNDASRLRAVCSGYFGSTFNSIHSLLNLDDILGKDMSLSRACNRFLGKPLYKAEQVSNWDERPLSASQLTYASLDAHSCLGVVSKLCSELTPDLQAVSLMYIELQEGVSEGLVEELDDVDELCIREDRTDRPKSLESIHLKVSQAPPYDMATIMTLVAKK